MKQQQIILAILLFLILIGAYMGFNPVLPGNDDANLNQINQLQQKVDQLGNVQIFKDSAGDRRVLLGRGKDNFYGLKVSKPGFDVYDTTDGNLVFNSGQNTFKIIDSGLFEFNHVSPNVDETQDYTHNLGYKPVVFCFLEGGIGGIANPSQLPIVGQVGGTGSGTYLNFQTYLGYYVNDTIIRFQYKTASIQPSATLTIRYFILVETID